VIAVPPGFEPLFRTSPFLETLGPFFFRRTPAGFVIGLRVAEKHSNARGTAHGGLLLTLADIALGYTAAFSEEPPLSLTTASLSTDFAGQAKIGDWIEAMSTSRRSAVDSSSRTPTSSWAPSALRARAPSSPGTPALWPTPEPLTSRDHDGGRRPLGLVRLVSASSFMSAVRAMD